MRGDVFGGETFGEVFEVLSPELGVWSVVEGDDDGVAMDTDIAIETAQEFLGERTSFVSSPRLAETLTQLVEGGLRDERHGHLGITDVEVECTRAFPAQVLRSMEELFNVPSFWVIYRKSLDFISVGGAEEGLEDIFGFAGTLNELYERQIGEMLEVKWLFSSGPSDPMGVE